MHLLADVVSTAVVTLSLMAIAMAMEWQQMLRCIHLAQSKLPFS